MCPPSPELRPAARLSPCRGWGALPACEGRRGGRKSRAPASLGPACSTSTAWRNRARGCFSSRRLLGFGDGVLSLGTATGVWGDQSSPADADSALVSQARYQHLPSLP